MKVSVLLIAFNEEVNLQRCLEALRWCDDIILVDSGSTDGTLDIAARHGVRVLHRSFDNFAAQRNFGLAQGAPKNEWVLHLDADEVVTPAFVERLAALQPPEGISGYHVPSKLMFHGRWLRHAGMYPSYQVRLGHRDRLRFRQVGHGQREDLPAEQLAIFDEPYLHFNFSHGLSSWFRKHVRYAEDEARELVADRKNEHSQERPGSEVAGRRSLKALSGKLPPILRPLARAIYMLVARRAFLDGAPGLLYTGMLCTYEAMIAAQVYELRLRGPEVPPSRTDAAGGRHD